MKAAVVVLVALALGAAASAADPVLLFPDGAKGAALRLDLGADAKNAHAAWGRFCSELFTHFDRDGDGSLSEAEAKRVFLLPLPGGREVAPDFAAMDADRDGKVSEAEFRAYYEKHGFTPITVDVRTAPAETFALADALFDHLDRDGDGKLSAAELKRAGDLLKRFDENEDEVLTAAELLGAGRAPAAPKPNGVKYGAEDGPAAVLKLADGSSALDEPNGPFRLESAGARLLVPGGACVLARDKGSPGAGFSAAKGFYLAQFDGAAGDKPAAKSLFEDDPTAQVLAGLFDAADRNGDQKLTRPELNAFFGLVGAGVSCRVVVTVTDRGRNLFDLFDADGRLTLDELTRAAKNLPAELARNGPVARGAVPASYHLSVGRGPVGDSFGPVPFGAAAKPKPPAPRAARGPKWFLALDKNGDGFVSRREFVGPPELFAKFDADGDGRISVEEAEAAKP